MTAHPLSNHTFSPSLGNLPSPAVYLPIPPFTLSLPTAQPCITSPACSLTLTVCKAANGVSPQLPPGLPSGLILLFSLLGSTFLNIVTNLLFHISPVTHNGNSKKDLERTGFCLNSSFSTVSPLTLHTDSAHIWERKAENSSFPCSFSSVKALVYLT